MKGYDALGQLLVVSNGGQLARVLVLLQLLGGQQKVELARGAVEAVE